MSPLAVSTSLESPEFQFEVVIFDEASQVLPWDAIGAVFADAHWWLPETRSSCRRVALARGFARQCVRSRSLEEMLSRGESHGPAHSIHSARHGDVQDVAQLADRVIAEIGRAHV